MAADEGFSVAPPTAAAASGLDLAKLANGRVVEVRVASLSDGIAVVASRHGMMQVDVAAFGRQAPAVGDGFRLQVRAIDAGGRATVTVVEQTASAAAVAPAARGGEAAAQVLAQAVRDAAANQSGLAPLYATLAGLAAAPKGSVPEPVRAVVAQLMQARLGDGGVPSAEAVRRAVVGSGVFLEARLAGGAVAGAKPGEDLKAALFTLRAALNDWVGASSKTGATATGGGSAGAALPGGGAPGTTTAANPTRGVPIGAVPPRTGGDGPVAPDVAARSLAGRAAGAYGGVGATAGADGLRSAGGAATALPPTGIASAGSPPGASGPSTSAPVTDAPRAGVSSPASATSAAAPAGLATPPAPTTATSAPSPAAGAAGASVVPGAPAPGGTLGVPAGAAPPRGAEPPVSGVASTPTTPAAGRAAAPTSASGAPTAGAAPPSGSTVAATPVGGAGTNPAGVAAAPGGAQSGAGIGGAAPGGTGGASATPAAAPAPAPLGAPGSSAGAGASATVGDGVSAQGQGTATQVSGTATPNEAPRSKAGDGEPIAAPVPAAVAAAPARADAAEDGVGALLKAVVRGLELAGSLTATRPTEAGEVVAALASLGPERDLRPAPPRRGQAPRGQAALAADRIGDDGAEGLGRRALERTEGALSRILLEQFAALDRRPEDAAPSGEARTTREWTVEMPLANAGGTGVVQMAIERDGGRGRGDATATKGWRVRFSLDVEPLGPIHAQIGLSGERLSIGLWAERPDAAARLGADVGRLQGALEAAAIPVESIHLATGRPASGGGAMGAGHLVDVKL